MIFLYTYLFRGSPLRACGTARAPSRTRQRDVCICICIYNYELPSTPPRKGTVTYAAEGCICKCIYKYVLRGLDAPVHRRRGVGCARGMYGGTARAPSRTRLQRDVCKCIYRYNYVLRGTPLRTMNSALTAAVYSRP